MATLAATPNPGHVGDKVTVTGTVDRFEGAYLNVTSDTGFARLYPIGVYSDGLRLDGFYFVPGSPGNYTITLIQASKKGKRLLYETEATVLLPVT